MWMTERLRPGAPQTQGAQAVRVTDVKEGRVTVQGDTTRQDLCYLHSGCRYSPSEGDRLLLLRAGGEQVIAGVIAEGGAGLRPGEVELRSTGGAVLRLCADGTIKLNGLTISKDGEIVGKTEGSNGQ